MEIENKKVIITGGASGIGRSVVERLLQENAVVGVLDINKKSLEELQKANPKVNCYACDVTKPSDIVHSIEEFCAKVGSIDILINNAGMTKDSLLINIVGGIKQHDIETWNKVIDTNLNSVFYMARVVAGKMVEKRTKGLIINVSSICAAGNRGQTAYSAAKAGVDALTKTWAKELSHFGIRVAGIAPGFTNTGITLKEMSEGQRKEYTKQTPLRRMAEPEEIADGILFIVRNDFFHGKILEIDGGLRL